MERKALERLVEALMDTSLDGNRVEAIEEALMTALIALEGHEYNDRDEQDLEENLDNLAVEVLVRRLKTQDISVYRIGVEPTDKNGKDERIEIVATSHPVLVSLVSHSIQQILKDDEQYFDIN